MTKTVDDRLLAALGDLAAMTRRRDEERKRADANWAEVQRLASELALERQAHDLTAQHATDTEEKIASVIERLEYLSDNAATVGDRRALRFILASWAEA